MIKATPFLTFTALVAAFYCNVAAADKLAFLVGNQNYQNDKPLRNPAHDVELLAERLRRIGFTVLPPLYNQGRTTLIDGLRELHTKIKPGDTVLVYFSGHGLQYQGENYLVPVDANIALANEIPDEAVGGSRVLSYLEEAGVKIVILDACRNNPYRSAGKGIGKGLGRQDASAVNNTLLAFAAAPGEEAQDGSGQYSPYAQALADAIVQPGQTLEQVFKTVRKSVREATGGEQEPWYNASLEDDLYLAGTKKLQPLQSAKAEINNQTNTGEINQLQIELNRLKDMKEVLIKNRKKLTDLNEDLAAITAESPTTLTPAIIDRYGIKMIPVTGGCFQMGSPSSEAGRYEYERQHEVCVENFKLGETEITQGLWRAVMGGNPSHFKNCGDACPVESVSWQDVQTFIAKFNQQTGLHYRLPSEAEWEYACRSNGKVQTYCSGDTVTRVAWYYENSGFTTHPVKQKTANGQGFYDMSGNVWEWTGSEWQDNYDGKHEKEITNLANNNARLAVRGGSWDYSTRYMRSANRDWRPVIFRYDNLGFRLAQD